MKILEKISNEAKNNFPDWVNLSEELEKCGEFQNSDWRGIFSDQNVIPVAQFIREHGFIKAIAGGRPIWGYILLRITEDLPNGEWVLGGRANSFFILAREIASVPRFDKPYVRAQLEFAELFCRIWNLSQTDPDFMKPDFRLSTDNMNICFQDLMGATMAERELSLAECERVSDMILNSFLDHYKRQGFIDTLEHFCFDDRALEYRHRSDWGLLFDGIDLRFNLKLAFEYDKSEVDSPYFIRRFE